MREMQTIVSDVRGVCLSVCPSVSLSVTRGHSVQPFPNDFGLLLELLKRIFSLVHDDVRR